VTAQSRPCPLAAAALSRSTGAIGDRNRRKVRADGAFDQADFGPRGRARAWPATMASRSPTLAGASRALEGFEQIRGGPSRRVPGRLSETSITTTRAFAPAVDRDLIAAGVLGVARLERLHGVLPREIEQDAEELVGESAIDRLKPALESR